MFQVRVLSGTVASYYDAGSEKTEEDQSQEENNIGGVYDTPLKLREMGHHADGSNGINHAGAEPLAEHVVQRRPAGHHQSQTEND